MIAVKLIFVFAICKSALSEQASLLTLNPCYTTDLACLTEATQSFLSKSSGGIPAYNIKPIDPLVLKEATIEVPECDMVLHYTNITLTGLKKQSVEDFKIDTTAKTVLLKMRVQDSNVDANLNVKLKKSGKTFNGKYYAKISEVRVISNYNFDIQKHDDGLEYFEVGPVRITAEVVSSPEISLDSRLQEALLADNDISSKSKVFNENADENRKGITSKFYEEAYVDVMHNLRTVARMLPKTAFFRDM